MARSRFCGHFVHSMVHIPLKNKKNYLVLNICMDLILLRQLSSVSLARHSPVLLLVMGVFSFGDDV